jgi:hypothetical protein|nr:MAG TPA: Tryptophan leader peptide [Caudoviricetes sp.]
MSKELEKARELVKMLEQKEKESKIKLSELRRGESFMIGEHEFIVLDQGVDVTKVISKGFMAENISFDPDTRDYNKSEIKKFIEEKIQPVIESEVGAENIVEHEVSLRSLDMQKEFEDVSAKVRSITFDEARLYNDLLVNEDLDNWWWTLTPWSTAKRGYRYGMSVVSPSGYFGYYCCNDDLGVRPFCILKSNIFVSKKGDK